MQEAPYGSWRSPISAQMVAKAAVRLGHLAVDGDDLYWAELRPAEGGRNVIVRRTPDGRTMEVNPAPFNARTRVHEYGGGDFAVAAGMVYFANYADQRLYCLDVNETHVRETDIHETDANGTRVKATAQTSVDGAPPPRPITAAGPLRYADAVVDRPRQRLICVREDHSVSGQQPQNTLVTIDLSRGPGGPDGAGQPDRQVRPGGTDGLAGPDGAGGTDRVAAPATAEASGAGTVLVSGHDFYAAPRLSPDGSRLAWLAWNHPNMPWDGTELWVADVTPDGAIANPQRVAGGSQDDGQQDSIFQPAWSPDGRLYFVSDRTGWWNLYRWSGPGTTTAEALTHLEAEFGQPQWVFGTATYGFTGPDAVVCAYNVGGVWGLARLNATTRRLEPIEIPYTVIRDLRASPAGILLSAGSPTEPQSLVLLPPTAGEIKVLRRASELAIDPTSLSVPQAVEFPTTGGQTAHAFYYPPASREFRAPSAERPPLLVKSHGGPTSAATNTLSLDIQYWTSRGIAVLDVNYGGSTGYGRAYRQR
ncbi:MAG: hypothetical protein M3442_16275, partial [Chloroflexota bacterium]|nr:hypothetical protein [Chloroflexota bacterium]